MTNDCMCPLQHAGSYNNYMVITHQTLLSDVKTKIIQI